MTDQKSFEMRVVFSVLETTLIAGTSIQEKQEFIEYLIGKPITTAQVFEYSKHISKVLGNTVPNRKEITAVLDKTILDKPRYLKLCDVYWHKHSFNKGCVPSLELAV